MYNVTAYLRDSLRPVRFPAVVNWGRMTNSSDYIFLELMGGKTVYIMDSNMAYLEIEELD